MNLRRVARAGLLTGVVDGLWACVLSILIYHSTFSRLWQGVAAALLGTAAFDGGTATVLLGLCIHFGVAFGWSAVFLLVVSRLAWIDRLLATRYGVIKVAALYGPFIWVVMSLTVIPVLFHRAPAISLRWAIQLVGHFPFVGIPIVASIGARGR